MIPGQYVDIEDDNGIIHTMLIKRIRYDNLTIVGEVQVYPSGNDQPQVKEIEVRLYQIIGGTLRDTK